MALFCIAAFLWLGFYLRAHSEPVAFMSFARIVRGHGIALALFFTTVGGGYVLGTIYAVLAIVAIANAQWRRPAIVAIVSGLVCWGLASGFQHYFARPRPVDWLIVRESAYSYPSSHAAIAIGFYFLCGVLILQSALKKSMRIAAFAALSALALGIMWSRLALAAHYPTDVLGGALLAAAVLCAGAGVLRLASPPGALS